MSNTDIELDEADLEPRDGETESDLVKRLRSTIRTKDRELKDLRPLKERLADIEIDNSLTKAFAKEELDGLTDRQRTALIREVGDDKSPDALRKAAEEFRWVEHRPDPLDEELAGHERVENVGRGAGASAAASLDPATVGGWATEKQMRFMRQYPDAWEQLKRGEAVHGISF